MVRLEKNSIFSKKQVFIFVGVFYAEFYPLADGIFINCYFLAKISKKRCSLNIGVDFSLRNALATTLERKLYQINPFLFHPGDIF